MSRTADVLVWMACGVGLTIAAWLVAERTLVRLPATALTAPAPVGWGARRLGRSLLGIVLVAVGIVFLFTPGPGVALVVVGLLLCDLPANGRVARWLLRHPSALRRVNTIRARHGAPPLEDPRSASQDQVSAPCSHRSVGSR